MRKLLYYLRGYSVLQICGAAPEWALNCLTENMIAFWDIKWIDPLTVRIKVFRRKEQTACTLINESMCDFEIVETVGIFQPLERLRHRPVLLTSLLICLLSILVIPCFVFFFEVEGNETVPKQKILRELDQSGVHFGIFGPKIYPRRVKDHMIEAIPKLQWVTVEQQGCRGTVIVREREVLPETETKKGFANVIASQSGVITSQSVYTGQAMFQPGDTVTKGDILVSGIVDLERTYLIERANAEIFARTWRQLSVCIPSHFAEKTDMNGQKRCVWLILGGKRIKIFGNSGISYDSCDKMINTKSLTLPGGLELPLSLEIETFSFYSETEKKLQPQSAKSMLLNYAGSATETDMIAGEVLSMKQVLSEQDGKYCMEATLECHEMIAEIVEAKWNNEDF